MRRSVTAAVVALSTALSVSAAALTSSAQATATPTTAPGRAEAQHALSTATAVVHGNAPHTDASMALLHLRLTMNALAPTDRRQAASILARPTSPHDYYGESYTVKAKRKCAGHICIHWVPTTADAPPSMSWVDKNLKLMNHVWNYEVHRLGYRRPISDGTRGGGGAGKFDVYLKELTSQSLYGLTVAEQRTSYNKRLYTSYMLLDNDFKGYPSSPGTSLKVTAAHEFFHAIQYAYDVREDPWMMEATSTWMEEQFDDAGNDNRQYLPYGQISHPGDPLDKSTNFALYGNWLFFQYLSKNYGRGVVKSIWKHAAAFAGGGHEFSAEAIRSALRSHGGLTSVFGRYASGNTVPAHTYSEGSAYPSAPPATTVTLTQTTPGTGWVTYHVKHLASTSVKALPGSDLTGTWRLRVRVDGPNRGKSPAVVVLVNRKNHPMTRALVHLSRKGTGSLHVPFGLDQTSSVTVTLANASTRYRCHRGTTFSCQGVPRAKDPAYALKLSAVQH